MLEIIQNEYMKVTVSAHGAELQSLRDYKDRELLWQGDPAYWGRRSPLLFPIVGSLAGGAYRLEGQTFELGRHGFARDMDFELVKRSKKSLAYKLVSNEETRRLFPYDFTLRAIYRLEDNALRVRWRVHNKDRRLMYFSIGGHPAFNLPDVQRGEPMHGTLLFEPSDGLERLRINTDGLVEPERHPVKTDGGRWAFTEESFKDDALVFDRSQLRRISLLDAEGRKRISVSLDAPAVGIWSPYGKNAPFVCIEPWFGVADKAGFNGELSQKYLINTLQPGAFFMGEYLIYVD